MSVLFSPYQLGGLTLDNRVVVSPMCQYSAKEGVIQPWHWMHIGGLAISGAAAVIMEATGVEAAGRISPGCPGLYTDEQEETAARLLRDVRTFSTAKIGVQLGHAGRKASILPFESGQEIPVGQGGWQTYAPSAIRFGDTWPLPEALDEAGMARIERAFVAAAQRADRAGFDLIELHGAHGYLMSEFLSPLANRRTDDYGGDLENRMRFPLRVAAAVRAVWPRTKAIGMRLSAVDFHPEGITIEETVTVAGRLKALGIDYVTTSAGGNVRPPADLATGPGYQVPYAERVRAGSGITTMAVGMILTPEQAEDIVASGKADLVAVARAMLDDPRWALHAANALGADVPYVRPYSRVAPARWPGYAAVHPAQAVA
jgi:NADPH2 dehydrogenase